MKRKEMVNYLQSNSTVELSKEQASYLLRLVELKGMKPPFYVKTISAVDRAALGTNHTAYYTGKIRVSEWEPENV